MISFLHCFVLFSFVVVFFPGAAEVEEEQVLCQTYDVVISAASADAELTEFIKGECVRVTPDHPVLGSVTTAVSLSWLISPLMGVASVLNGMHAAN